MGLDARLVVMALEFSAVGQNSRLWSPRRCWIQFNTFLLTALDLVWYMKLAIRFMLSDFRT